MKAVSLFFKRIHIDESKEKLLKIILGVICAAASGFLGYFLEFGIPVMILLALAGFLLQFYLKLFKITYQLPIIYHVIAVTISASFAIYFAGYIEKSAAIRTAAGLSATIMLIVIVESLLWFIFRYALDDEHPSNLRISFLSVFPLMVTTELYVPSETYFINSNNYIFSYFDFALILLLKTVFFTFTITVMLCTLKKKLFDILTRLFVGLTLCTYCQYMFMNNDLQVATGDITDWDKLHDKIIVNAVIWVILLLLPFALGIIVGRIKKLSENSAAKNIHIGASALIGGIQLVSLVMLMVTSKVNLINPEHHTLSNKEQFTVSSNKNIITIILDMADRYYFEEEYEKAPEEFDCLKDFTYYNNACMMYDSTYISIPQMLSGATELPEDNLKEWVKESWQGEPCEEFYSRLHENGYKVNIYGDFCYDYSPLKGKVDNCLFLSDDMTEVDHFGLTRDMEELSAFRYMPLLLKKHFELSTYYSNNRIIVKDKCVLDNRLFIEALDLKTSDENNYFIVEHLNGTHGLEDFVTVETPRCMTLVNNYLAQLKELGVYDDSIIIITADHGAHSQPDNMPIWYIKPAGAHNDEMQYCSAPIYHADYLATILDTAGLSEDGDEELFGRSIFDIPEDEDRERLVFQRAEFEYTGDIEWERWSDQNHPGALFGYYFRGTREDLVAREMEGPPDILIELDSSY